MAVPCTADRRDRAIALLLLSGTIVLLASLPRNLGDADESYFLYESKRIRDGAIMYRDVFQFITPLASYLMATLFWAFGTSMATARVGMAFVHGLTVAVSYATCRALGVRRSLAVLPPLAYLAICQPAWQFASPHWVATFLATLLVFVLVAGPWPARPGRSVVPGLVAGALIGVQQQKGVAAAAGVCLLFVVDHLLDRRYPAPEPRQYLAVRLGWFGIGSAVVVVPLLASSVLLAGAEPVFEALVRYPLRSYVTYFATPWGGVHPLAAGLAAYTMPALLAWSPLPALGLLLPAASDLLSRTRRSELRALTVLVISAGSSVVSIWYYPDYVHLAFIAPVFLVCAAELLEIAFGRTGVASVAAARCVRALSVLLAGALILQLARVVALTRSEYPISHDTAFGRVDFAQRWEPVLVETIHRLLAEARAGELFCYPNCSSFYLTTGAENPTPYQFFAVTAAPATHTERVLSILRGRRLPYVVLSPLLVRPGDPVAQLVLEDYERLTIPEIDALGEPARFWLFGRKDRARPAS